MKARDASHGIKSRHLFAEVTDYIPQITLTFTEGHALKVTRRAISLLTSSSAGHLVHNLAVEILGETFIRCLSDPPNPISSKDVSLLLLQVCRH